MFVVCKLPGDGLDLSYSIRDHILAQARSWARMLLVKPLKPFYSYNIRYKPEPLDSLAEEWVDPYTVVQRGYGDCDDLVTFRLAQILNEYSYDLDSLTAPLPAWPAVARQVGTGAYHVFIGFPDRPYEDPAKIQAKKFGGVVS
jgi:hypothetical protein